MLLIFILIFIFDVAMIGAQGSEDGTLHILCQFEGQRSGSSYKFDLGDVSERCDLIISGYYNLDNSETPVLPQDQEALTKLVKAGQEVYIMVGVSNEDGWNNIFYPPDENLFTNIRNKLVRFLFENTIAGIILDTPNLYNGNADLAEKIKIFAKEIKKLEVNELQVGLIIDGNWYKEFSKIDLFDYSIINTDMDLLIIDTTKVNECTPETKISGVLPVLGNHENLISLDQICNAVYYLSNMEKSKLYIRLLVGVRRPTLQGDVYQPTSYSEYCNDFNRESGMTSQWCADTSLMLYEKGQLVRGRLFQGIMLSEYGTDDFCNNCDCEEFSISNKIIDGWELIETQECEKIDKP